MARTVSRAAEDDKSFVMGSFSQHSKNDAIDLPEKFLAGGSAKELLVYQISVNCNSSPDIVNVF